MHLQLLNMVVRVEERHVQDSSLLREIAGICTADNKVDAERSVVVPFTFEEFTIWQHQQPSWDGGRLLQGFKVCLTSTSLQALSTLRRGHLSHTNACVR